LITAAVLVGRNRITRAYADRVGDLNDRTIARCTVLLGASLGVLVTMSSIGAGVIGVTVLVLLHPRLSSARIVGCDIAHAVPLTLVAGLGHGALGSLDPHVLVSLLAGSLPGVLIGSSVSARVPDVALRYVLAGLLACIGAKLAFEAPIYSVATLSTAR